MYRVYRVYRFHRVYRVYALGEVLGFGFGLVRELIPRERDKGGLRA